MASPRASGVRAIPSRTAWLRQGKIGT